MTEDCREQPNRFHLSPSLLRWLCVVLLLMSNDIESNPGPEERADFLQFMDLRFSQIWQGMNMNTANICKMVDEKFKTLQQTLRHVVEEINRLKDQAQEHREDIEDLQDDRETVLRRLDKLEQRQESAEMDSKRCNLRFFGIQEPRRGMNYPCAEQIVDVLNDYSNGRTWTLTDVKHAFRIGDFRQHNGDPRPMVVQFCVWTDKMSILTDRELREELRQDGIKVTGDLTSRQREMVEFYRNQGQTVYYRNGRLHFADKWQQQNSRTTSYQREGYNPDQYGAAHIVDGQPLRNEDWPYLTHVRQARQEQIQTEDQWKRVRNDKITDHPSERNARRRPQLQQQYPIDSDEAKHAYSDVPEHYVRKQTDSGRSLYDNRHGEEGSSYGLSGQYRRRSDLRTNCSGDREGGQHIVPGHYTYTEAVQSGPDRASKREQQLRKPPINKARGLDARPRSQRNMTGGRDTMFQYQGDKWTFKDTAMITVEKDDTVRRIQMKSAPQNDQQWENTNDTTTKEKDKQNGDEHTDLNSDLFDGNSVVHEEDCDTDKGNNTTIQVNSDQRDQNSDCDKGQTESDSEEDHSRQGNADQDVLTERTDRDVETAPDDLVAVFVQQSTDTKNPSNDKGSSTTNTGNCEQNTQSHSQEKVPDRESINAQENCLSTESDKTPDRAARNRRKNPTAQTRHTDCTPKTNRSSSQSSILETLRQMGSKERSKDGRQEFQGGTKTRAKSVHNK